MESVILDPPAAAGTRIPLDLTRFIAPEGPDWGDAAIEDYVADRSVGSIPLDYRVPNRTVTIPIQLLDEDGLTFEEVRTRVQQTAGLWQAEGGWLARTVGGRTVYLDVVGASLKLGGGTLQAIDGIDVDARLELETLPDWYGDEIGDTADRLDTFPTTGWTLDAGSDTLRGQAIPYGMVPTDTTEKRPWRNDVSWYDSQVEIEFVTPSSLTGTWSVAVVIKRVDANNYLYAQIDNGGSISVSTVIGGRHTVQAGVATTALSTSTTYWLRGRVEGNIVYAEIFSGSAPTLGSVPSAASTTNGVTLSGSAATTLGVGVSGSPGLRLVPNNTNWLYKDFLVQPNVYTERTISELVTPPIQQVAGNFPRGNRCRIRIADAQGVNRRGIMAAFRHRYYDDSASAALVYEAEDLTLLDTSSVSTVLSGTASGGRSVVHSAIGTNWTSLLQLTIATGAEFLTHVGSYRMIARVLSTTGTPVSLRALYDVGDVINPTINDAWGFPAAWQWYYADLGEIRLDRAPIGNHRWSGVIQAMSTTDPGECHIDKIVLVPLDDFAAWATAVAGTSVGIQTIPARDSFSQSAGALTGKTATVGGVWAGVGDADDFQVSGSGSASRTAVSDASGVLGRYATVGSVITDTYVTCRANGSGTFSNSNDKFGVLLRFVDTNNWAFAGWSPGGLAFKKCVAGVVTTIGLGDAATVGLHEFSAYWPYGSVDTDGNWTLGYNYSAYGVSGSVQRAAGQDPDLGSGGALARGRVGLLDCRMSASAMTRTYDDFYATASISDAAMYANTQAELRTDGLWRQDISGTAYSKISVPRGALPRIPCEGAERRPVEVLVAASRGDFDQLPDSAMDDLAIQVLWRPCYWFTPDT